tara:strand:- start:38 stop:544 length:507 start_codon:yes stop_codon:yes gene_type:complete
MSLITLNKLALPTGSLLQNVTSTSSSSVTVSSNTYTDLTGMSVNITPSSTSNKILIHAQVYFYIAASGVTENYAGIELVRDSTVVHRPPGSTIGPFGQGIYTASITTDKVIQSLYSFHYLDSPSSTSQITYKLQGRPFSSAKGDFIYNRDTGGGGQPTSSITAMEIKG